MSLKRIVIPRMVGSMALLFALAIAGEARAETVDTQKGIENNTKEASSYHIKKMGTIHFTTGLGFFDFDSLNDRLSQSGFSKIDQPSITLGLGIESRLGRVILGGEGNWLANLGSEAERDGYKADLRGGYWLFRTGFDVVQWKGLSIYPLLGIGSGHMKLRIQSELDASFNDVLENPARDVTLYQNALLLDASLGIDYRFKIRQTEDHASFFTIGVRGGYLFSPWDNGWNTAGAEISGGPDSGLSGPTVQLMIGFTGSGTLKRGHSSHRSK